MTGIYDCFGYGSGYDVSFEERYKLIRKSGFDCVMLWWSNQGLVFENNFICNVYNMYELGAPCGLVYL